MTASIDAKVTNSSTFPSLNTEIAPLTESALRNIVDCATTHGDKLESAYLELKSKLDLGDKKQRLKVVKFLLGAANRVPAEALRHFQGYAVLAIGVEKGRAGIPAQQMEEHELKDHLRHYLGPNFPDYQLKRIAVENDLEVLFIIASPPSEGQEIFPCRKTYDNFGKNDSLLDGDIFVRNTSATRKARASEIDALIVRARSKSAPEIDLEIEAIGAIFHPLELDTLIDSLYTLEEETFLKYTDNTSLTFTDEQLALGKWRNNLAMHKEKSRIRIIGAALHPFSLRITSWGRFISKPHLEIFFHNCAAYKHLSNENQDWGYFITPIEPEADYSPFRLQDYDFSHFRTIWNQPTEEWDNKDEYARVVLTPESFRPDSPWVSENDNYVLVTRRSNMEKVRITWRLTEANSDKLTEGEFIIDSITSVNMPSQFRRIMTDEN
ncbi:MAG: hypothetical protein Q4C87_09975 [Actinomycetaceae bacterium]|nr:hypothetical protein [Actinomycetaceae bacterium]